LLRKDEDLFMNQNRFDSHSEYKANLKKVKKIRFGLFYLAFVILLVSLYGYAIYFSLNHTNDIAVLWVVLSIFCMIFDFIIFDFLLII